MNKPAPDESARQLLYRADFNVWHVRFREECYFRTKSAIVRAIREFRTLVLLKIMW